MSKDVLEHSTRNEYKSTLSTDSAMLKDIIELNPYGIAVFDIDGRYVKSNQAYINLFKLPPPPHITLFNAPTIKKPGVEEELAKLADGKTVRIPPFWHNSRDAGEQWPDNPICIGGVVFPLRGEDGSIKNYIAMFEDVTTRVRAEEKLLEAVKVKSNFMATISHELRTPLFGIIASIELILKDKDLQLSERRAENLHNALESADVLLLMINNILDTIKIENGKIKINAEQFSIVDVIRSSIAPLKPLAETKQIPIELNVTSDLPMLFSDKQKIGFIITNLISNAIKYTDSGKVVITADAHKDDPNRIEVSVRDTGIGIPKDELLAIFEHFKQIDESSTKRFGGIGLGLAIVRAYAKLLGGSIDVKSEVGQGSTFTVTLPLTSRYLDSDSI